MEAVTYDDLDKWVTNGTSTNGEDLVDTLVQDAKIIIDQNGTKYLITDIVNLYEVLNGDRTSQSPKAYIYDLDGSLASNKITNDDEYICDENGYVYNIPENFPDAALRTALISNTTGNSSNISTQVSDNVINPTTVISIIANNSGLTDLTGLEVFNNLDTLKVDNNTLNALDTISFPLLTTLSAANNNLTSVDLSENAALTNIQLAGNSLTEIDISNCLELDKIILNGNKLTSIDFTNNIKLTYLNFGDNPLTNPTMLDFSMLIELKELWIWNLGIAPDKLTTLDVSANTKLTTLVCHSNNMTSLNITGLNVSINTNITSGNALGTSPTWAGIIR